MSSREWREVVRWTAFILAIMLTTFMTLSALGNLMQNTRRLAVRLSELEERVDVLQGQLDALQGELDSLRAVHRESMDYIEQELDKFRVVTLTVTAYAPFDNQSGICNDGDPNYTATGSRPDWGTIAVNPAVFPYGTKMYIPGYGWGVAVDTGGAIRRRTDLIDVYMDTYQQAINWGRRVIQVLVEVKGE